MHMNLGRSYVAARDERIKEATTLFAECPEHFSHASEGRSGGRIVLGAQGAFMLAAFIMIASPLAGFLMFGFGACAILIGLERLLRAERVVNAAFSSCLTQVDVFRPELIETMKRYAHERVKERWSSDTI